MNEASRWRLELAKQIAPLYDQPHQAQVIMVGGSVSRHCADRYSDIEVGIFWTTPPTEEFRQEIAQRAGGTLYRSFSFQQEEWSEEYLVSGVKLDIRHRLVSGVERWLSDVIDNYETTVSKQVLISALEYGVPLAGAPLLKEWQAKIKPYPQGLAEAMVRGQLMLGPSMWLEILAERNSLIELYSIFGAIQKKLLCVLMGLNRVYHPGFKWPDRLVADLAIAPCELGARLRQVLLLAPCEGVPEILSLIDETYQLVEHHLPSVEIASAWAYLKQTIPICDRSPFPERTGDGQH